MALFLLQTLGAELAPELQHALSDDTMKRSCEEYLGKLLVNDDLLSTENFTTTTENDKKTIIEEVAELDQESRRVNDELASITNTNRDLIIDINDDLQKFHTTFTLVLPRQIETVVKALDSKVCVTINEKLVRNVDVNNTILTNMDSILDILELPTLCKLCVLQGNYHEALEVSILVKSLMIKFPKLAIFHDISDQVEHELLLMVKGLIKLLNTDLKHNNMVKIFQILQKLDTGKSKQMLKTIYLQGRFRFITLEIAALKPLIRFNKLTYLKRFIEVYREHIFTSLSTFVMIFKYQQEDYDDGLINSYVTKLADVLIEELAVYLPEVDNEEDYDESQKDGLILQIIYMCKSLAKFHVSFETVVFDGLVARDLIGEDEWYRNLKKVRKFRE
jgi:hypothetical protein